MSIRVDTNSLIPGAIVCGNRGLGVLGSTILLTTSGGTDGNGVLYNDVEAGDEAKEFRAYIVTPPTEGELYMDEDGTFTYAGGPDTFTYEGFVDGVSYGTSSVVLYDDVVVQFYRPTGDVSAPGWLSTAATLAGAINETTPNNTSYITSPDVNTAAPALLSLPSLPAGTYTARVTARRTGAVGELRLALFDASSNPVGTSSWQALGNSYSTYSLPVAITGTATRFHFEVRP